MIAASLLAAFAGGRPARFPSAEVEIRGRLYGFHGVEPANDQAVACCPRCERTTADSRCASCDQSGCPLRHNRGDAR